MDPLDGTRYEVETAIRIGRASFVCVYTIHLYEWLLNLDEERCLIHMSSWSSVKVLYIICRYYPLVVFPFHLWAWMDNHSTDLCKSLVHGVYAALIPMQISAQGVMLLRAYAFTGKKTYILVFFSASWLAIFAADIWLYGTQFICKILNPRRQSLHKHVSS
ncbi:hypothetical protein CONPUDRAFT_123862 [Coniophora puteana RWD-64-598 SS2]|uniref:DUF6533 domain-containing protein n=1 Tax=Coniophora puteana (strain RWD-64-598) TaxID=741705 RepID=A0A5M3MPA0_CONPW|nr:uncharacterized protein CONPUDRAFT_123862 [Coniophora puteana RWD-64-598 SS2]EIW80999.1 hypothetical protein CONPUDRAFT_123862 [Coniophora puteana RWD-64-598 SS2]